MDKTEKTIVGIAVLLALVGGGLYFIRVATGTASAQARVPPGT